MKFAGYECVIQRIPQISGLTVVFCPEKKVKVFVKWVTLSIQEKKRVTVGWNTETNETCDMWEEDGYVHIGCLREEKKEFLKNYITLIKHLNTHNGEGDSSK